MSGLDMYGPEMSDCDSSARKTKKNHLDFGFFLILVKL